MGKRQHLHPDIVSTNPSNCTLTKRHTLQLFLTMISSSFLVMTVYMTVVEKFKMLVRLKRAIDSGEATTNATPF
jgi:hypothetical protein